MAKKIIIVEGPAGSGKSTLIDSWGKDVIRIPRLNQSVGRDFGPRSASLSMIKDHHALILAFSGVPGPKPYVIDRCFFSQFIYEQIRTGQKMSGKTFYRHFEIFLEMLNIEYMVRSFRDKKQEIQLQLVFTIPDITTLMRFRGNTTKVYPFNPMTEIELYQDLHTQVGGLLYTPDKEPHEFLGFISRRFDLDSRRGFSEP